MNPIDKEVIFTGSVIDDNATFNLQEICRQYEISEELLKLMVEHSLIEPQPAEKGHLALNLRSLQRMQKALHLQRDLEINLQGVVLALELLDELEHVRHELVILHRHLQG